MPWIRCAIVVAVVGAALSCHKASTAPTSEALVFSFSPMDLASITEIVPLGNLNPPDHTLPTNHEYFYHSAANFMVTAPAGGKIVDVRHSTDDSISIQATSRATYYLYHLILDAGIVNGGTVTAGQRLGVTIPVAGGLDLGLYTDDVTLFFVRPDRYIPLTLHADSGLKYFDEPTKSALYAKVTRQGDDKDGKINFDQAGRLAGNWFVEGLPAANTESVDNGPKQLSFARDVKLPSIISVSIGGTLAVHGAFFLADGAVDPANVSTSTGRVSYELFTNTLRAGTSNAHLLVQLIADDRIRIEAFPGSTTAPADFTGAALIYTR